MNKKNKTKAINAARRESNRLAEEAVINLAMGPPKTGDVSGVLHWLSDIIQDIADAVQHRERMNQIMNEDERSGEA